MFDVTNHILDDIFGLIKEVDILSRNKEKELKISKTIVTLKNEFNKLPTISTSEDINHKVIFVMEHIEKWINYFTQEVPVIL